MYFHRMNREETNALQMLTGKTHLEEVTVEALQQLADEHPYFSATQLLLCKKMQQENHSDLQRQIYKTALYFPDEQWLRYHLIKTKPEIAEDNLLLPEEFQPDIKITEPVPESIPEETDTIDDITNEPLAKDILQPQTNEETVVTDEVSEHKKETTEEANFLTLPIEKSFEEISTLADIQGEPEEIPLDEEELAQQTEPLPIEESNQKIASLLSEQAEAFHKTVSADEVLPIETEPFHTIDYFASQGIKLDAKKEDTSFDKKVHKFTDWLRQMKRINPQPADLGTGTEEESHIAHIAATSNQTREIVTESMAEVLIKQYKYDKAIEIYEKLSLLYPFKNAYFAAKIQQLKQ